jgi:RHS repeat-associated protein
MQQNIGDTLAAPNRYLYNGKELQQATDWVDYGARMYDPTIGRFFTQDRFAEKYRTVSPYQYAANDPINLVDINGDSIWFDFQYNKAGELSGVTMNVTGKVMNLSSDDIDMENAVSDISSAISSSFNGSFEVNGEGISFNTNVQLSEASSMDDVSGSDHLFVIGDNNESSANGAANMSGGKVAFLNAADFADKGSLMGYFGWSDTRTSTHEFGHLAGLSHESASGFSNLMKSGGSGTNVTPDQLKKVTYLGTNNGLNRGENYIRNPLTGKKSPNSTLMDMSGKAIHINQVGIRLRLDNLK